MANRTLSRIVNDSLSRGGLWFCAVVAVISGMSACAPNETNVALEAKDEEASSESSLLPVELRSDLIDPSDVVLGTPNERARSLERRIRERDSALARCMRSSGFEFVEMNEQEVAQRVLFDTDSELLKWNAVYPQGVGLVDRLAGRSGVSLADPNAEYFETLSTEDKDRYVAARWGVPNDQTDRVGEVESCESEASEAVADSEARNGGDRLSAVFDALESRPAFRELSEQADTSYSSCMAELGYGSLSERAELVDLVERRAAEAGAGTRQLTREELVPLHDFERSVFAADSECWSRVLDDYGPSISEEMKRALEAVEP